jgi:hypothetical protein
VYITKTVRVTSGAKGGALLLLRTIIFAVLVFVCVGSPFFVPFFAVCIIATLYLPTIGQHVRCAWLTRLPIRRKANEWLITYVLFCAILGYWLAIH